MSSTVITVKGLSKQYRIGGQKVRYKTLRDTLTSVFMAPFHRRNNLKSKNCNLQYSSGLNSADNFWALKDVSFEIQQGDVIGIIGRNGAGKTTLLKILSRITEPTEGEVELKGRVGSLLEVGTGFHPELTGRENIYLNGAILGMSKAEINKKFDEIVAFAEIEKFLDTPMKRYSTGMGTRLAFAIAAHLEPEILLVDEVLSVGDIAFRKKCFGKMQDVSHEGRTVLFVSHEMNAIRRLCKNGLWLDKGRVAAIGDVCDIVRKYEESVLGSNSFRACRVERQNPPNSPKHFFWVSLASADGEPLTVFRFGDILRLTIGMEGRTSHSTHFVEWFLNEPTQGNRVAWGATHALPEGDINGNAKEMSFLIGPLPLAEGQYSISLAMGVPAIINLDFWQDAIIFEICGCDPGETGYSYNTLYAPIFIPYKVDIK